MDMLLPEIWVYIILHLDYNTIKKLCLMNMYIKNLCNTNHVRKLLVAKFSQDSLNTSNFTRDELIFYEKIKSLKNKRMFLRKNEQFYSEDDNLYILYNDYLITLPQYKSKEHFIEQRKKSLERKQPTSKDLRYLTGSDNDGNCTDVNFLNSFYPLNKFIINILIDNSAGISITTKEGETYKFGYKCRFIQINAPFIIIQSIGNLYLSHDGDIYQGDRFNSNNPLSKIEGLDKIKELASEHKLLSVNGNVYIRHADAGSKVFELIENLKNIKQIYLNRPDYGSYYLDNQCNIISNYYDGDLYFKIVTEQNIIEIISVGNFIYALNDNMKLYMYTKFDRAFYHSYDLLDL